MLVPRPDQRAIMGPPGMAGSRSGAGDLAGALAYPGVPGAVPNCQSAEKLHAAVGITSFYTFPAAGRIWRVILSYTITANPSFSLATVRTYARIVTSPGAVTLAVVDLGLANAKTSTTGQSEPVHAGLPVTGGQSLVLDVNNGALVANLDQQASAVVLYSIP